MLICSFNGDRTFNVLRKCSGSWFYICLRPTLSCTSSQGPALCSHGSALNLTFCICSHCPALAGMLLHLISLFKRVTCLPQARVKSVTWNYVWLHTHSVNSFLYEFCQKSFSQCKGFKVRLFASQNKNENYGMNLINFDLWRLWTRFYLKFPSLLLIPFINISTLTLIIIIMSEGFILRIYLVSLFTFHTKISCCIGLNHTLSWLLHFLTWLN